MGAKDSKQNCITYEEAVKRVTEAELKRLKEAFKRLSNLNGFISKQSFVKDVLGDGVPVPVAEYIYTACGGTAKGIVLKELLCGLVLITRGTEEEKIRFLFGLYSNESGTHVVRDEFQKHLHICESGYIPDSIGSLFNERGKDRATYEEFRDWLREYPDATSLSRWLLCEPCTVTISNELETPTFYQTLAGVTHLEESDIIELEKRYWVLKGESRTGKLDLETLRPLISPPVPLSVCAGVFAAFDENRDNHIDFKEMACGISAATRGPMAERQKFCFKVFDLDRDGFLSDDEMEHMVTVLIHVRNENNVVTKLVSEDETQPGLPSPKQPKLEPLNPNEPQPGCSNVNQPQPGSSRSILSTSKRDKPRPKGKKRKHAKFGTAKYVRSSREVSEDETQPGLPSLKQPKLEPLNPKEPQPGCSNVNQPQPGSSRSILSTSKRAKPRPKGKKRKHAKFGAAKCVRSSRKGNEIIVEEKGVLAELRRRASPKGLTIEEYLMWSMESNLSMDFLCLLFQVCHIVLGLRPTSSQEEGEIVRGWLDREEKRGYSVGQFWYLIAIEWWNSWLEYVGFPRTPGSVSGSEISLNNITSSEYNPTGSLKRVAQRLTGSNKRTIVENCLALENSPVVVTGITSLEPTEPQGLTPQSVSATPSPSQSPRPVRRPPGPPSLPVKPGPIDNTGLVAPPMFKVNSLTGEGGKLKKNLMLVRSRDFELVPDSLWKALSQWYGGSPALPRQVILPKGSVQVELELYPITVKLLRHQSQPARPPQQPNTWSGMVGGYGAAALRTTGYAYVSNLPTPPKRYLAYLATFSRMATVCQVYDFLCERLHFRDEDMRLWLYRDENNMVLIEEEDATLEDLGVCDEDQLLVEIRNKDLTWPEEMGSLVISPNDRIKQPVATEKGATGLNNLGNTCFMNSALQCVSNTRILTRYFINNFHLYELNRTNPLGMKGHIAKRYGDLIHEIWSGSAKTVAPLKLRWTIGKYAPRFNGSQQNDSQELLAFLLDGLHEDLNRVHDKPYVELNDSDGRSDVNVAQEAWENHILRNKSIIVDLFHGQLKSKVRCKVCGHESVRFDPFNYLSLPLPMESYVHIQVTVIRLDGSVPTKYGLRLNMDDKYGTLKQHLSNLCSIQPFFIKLAELSGSQIKSVLHDEHKIKPPQSGALYAYELPTYPSGSIFGDEERLSINSLKSQREAHTFQAIQRSIQPNVTPAVARGMFHNPTFQGEEHNIASSPTEPEMCVDGLAMEVTETIPDSGNCSASSCSLADSIDTNSCHQPGFIIAFHRKMIQQDVYFVSSQKSKPSLFGLPVIVPCCDNTTHQDLYQTVWVQVARLVSPLPPSETAPPNHAMDCDDSLGYEFPFVLKAVNREGTACAWCPWYRFCRGCRIQCCDTEFNFSSNYLAIDWDPTALHLRYQTAQEKVFEEHSSVHTMRQLQMEPINLDYCLEAFTKEEQLGEEEKYYCSKCKQHQLASKKLEIWRLPPILIVHLKRFQFLNGKWVKSQKVVKFPFENFEPTTYLASIPRETVARHKAALQNKSQENSSQPNSPDPTVISTASGEGTEPLQDFHQHLLCVDADPFDLRYNLYAIVSHSGILGGGHYVSYANNPNGKWYCYNDSSCKEVTDLDTSSAYMLFYERKGICESRYMPNISGRLKPDTRDLDDEFDSDLKKMCSLM